jgi:hypothetical protein
MNDGIYPVLFKARIYILRDPQVALIKISPPDEVLIAVNKVVKGNRVETAEAQFLAAMRADIAGPAFKLFIKQ